MTESMAEEKKLRFFGDGDAFGDGHTAWVHIGDNVKEVQEAIKVWIENLHPGDRCEIKTKLMTDAEIAALPEI